MLANQVIASKFPIRCWDGLRERVTMTLAKSGKERGTSIRNEREGVRRHLLNRDHKRHAPLRRL